MKKEIPFFLKQCVWLPVVCIAIAMIVVWRLDLRGVYESHFLVTAMNFVFTSLPSVVVVYVAARGFAATGNSGLLWFGFGVLVWGATGNISSAMIANNVNEAVTIHNTGLLIAAGCHLIGVLLTGTDRKPLLMPGRALMIASVGVAGTIGLLVMATFAGQLPVFFIQGQGGTPLRFGVLGATAVLYLASAALMLSRRGQPPSWFQFWYSAGLVLLTCGVLGIMFQPVVAGVLGWLGRSAQYLGGAYLTVAAIISGAEARVWGVNIQRKLHESEERFRLFMDNSPTVAYVKDEQGRYIYLNRTCEERFGMPLETWRGKTDAELWPSEVAAEYRVNDLNVLTADRPLEVTEETREPDGRVCYWLSTKFPFCDTTGKRYLAGISLDITERKRAEEELRRYANELAAANKELESFSYSVSHDLRSPLRAIKGFSDILLEDYADKLDEEGTDLLKRITISTDRMAAIIDDMLAMAKISRESMDCKEIDLSSITDSIVNDLRQNEPQRNVEITITQPLPALADPRLTSIALTNLIGNAWKYSSKNPKARIEIGVLAKDSENVFFVRDNGAGFDMNLSHNLFQPFNRLHSDSQFSGTGIGLAIVHKIIQRHNGRIWAESEIGKGSTFYFTLASKRGGLEDNVE